MKPLEAKNQVRLGLGRCVHLAFSGVSHRLLRSGITTAILALAVAFLVHVLAHAVLVDRVQRAAWEALGPTRLAEQTLNRLTTVDPPQTIREVLARPAQHKQTSEQYAHWLKKTGSTLTLNSLAKPAQSFAAIQRWASRLTPAQSAALLGGLTTQQQLALLQSEPTRAAFGQRLKTLKVDWPLGSQQGFESWLKQSKPTLDLGVALLRQQHASAIERFAAADPRDAVERFAEPAPALAEQLAIAGFSLTQTRLEQLADYAQYRLAVVAVTQALQRPKVRHVVAAERGSAELFTLMKHLAAGGADASAWWKNLSGNTASTPTAIRFVREHRLAAAAPNDPPSNRRATLGLPKRTLWLAALSLLVCVVGVTNAMLMSVTERFSEIATMKCLGAMDRSVMLVFVVEALVQGVVGGVIGGVIGLALAVGRGFFEFGWLFASAASAWSQVLGVSGAAILLGVALATLASVGPSWVASRLSPMEAMRVE